MAEIKKFTNKELKELIIMDETLDESLTEYQLLTAKLNMKVNNGVDPTEAEIDQLITLMAQVSRDSSEISDWLLAKGKPCPTDTVDYVKIAKEEKAKVYGMKIVE